MIEPVQGGHGDSAAYVLGALDAAARQRFEQHAAACPECQKDLAAFGPVADRLALAVPQAAPPERLRDRLLARAAMEAAEQPRAVPAFAAPPPEAAPTPHLPWWKRGSQISTGLAAAALAVALFSGTYAVTAHQQLARTSEAAAVLSETLSIMYQPGMVPRPLSGTDSAPGAKGKVYLVPDGTTAVVLAYDLPRLRSNEAYQCWLVNDEERRVDGGVFKVDDQGRGRWLVRTEKTLNRYRTLGVTKEPAKGSTGPTGPRVLGGQL